MLFGAAVGIAAAWWLFPSRAEAATCNVHYFTDATDNSTNVHRGMGVANPGMYIYDYDAFCVQDSSVGVTAGSGDLVEIGWRDPDSGYQACTATGDDNPHLFVVDLYFGAYSCTQFNVTLTPWQSDGFGAADQNADKLWSFTHDGNLVQSMYETFSSGVVWTNGERHNTTESARALFDGARYMASDGWHAWSTSHCYYAQSNDPVYNNQLLSATKIKVTAEAPQC